MKYSIAFLFFIVHSIAHGRLTLGSNCSNPIKGKIVQVGYRPGEPLYFDRMHETVTVTIEVQPEVTCEIRFDQESFASGVALFPLVGKSIELKTSDKSYKVSQ